MRGKQLLLHQCDQQRHPRLPPPSSQGARRASSNPQVSEQAVYKPVFQPAAATEAVMVVLMRNGPWPA